MKNIKKIFVALFCCCFFSNSFISPSYSAEKIPTDAEEINNILLWSIIPLFMHFSLLANDVRDSEVGLESEFLVMRNRELIPKSGLMWGLKTQVSVIEFRTMYPIIDGKFEGMIQDMGVKVPFFKNKYVSIFPNVGISLGRYYRDFAWGGYASLGAEANISNFGISLEGGYRNLNSKSLINSFTLSGNATYKF